ncbi:tetratricopeptide repeat protein [Candidatus Fermentibacteria bacterium]|nr:tetratricopeptide repeat protein [Candidatus Fermentibacteria bacterium]
MSEYMKIHDRIADDTISDYDGQLVKHTGDGIFAAFNESEDALSCALELQKKLQSDSFPVQGVLLRMGLHYGEAQERNRDFFGPAVITAQRVMDASGGGQILVTEPFCASCSELPDKVELKPLGTQKLRDLSTPIELFMVMHPELIETGNIPLRTLSSVPNNIERPLTPFVGRQKELHEICAKLKDKEVRLLTLHGPGGTGKTRLAMQVAARECWRFPGGVFFIQLEHIHKEEQIPFALADVLDLKHTEVDELKEAIFKYLSNKRILLVLDNYEHLLPDVDFLQNLLHRTQDLKVLITSRSRLGLVFEHIYEISGLGVPEDNRTDRTLSDSQRLYYKTVQRLSGTSIHARRDQDTVGRICSLLRGNPLGIVLAASWDGMLSPSEILTRLREGLGLDANVKGLPGRHQSLEAVFVFSWNTLSSSEKEDLCALSVFRNNFSKKTAEKVCGVDIKGLVGLVSKSLVEKHEDGTFSIHSLIREFAREKTPLTIEEVEYRQLLGRHCEYFLGILHANSENILEGNRSAAAKELAGLLEDILAAWEFAIKDRAYAWIERSARSLRAYLGMKGLYEDGAILFSQSLDKLDGDDSPASRKSQGLLLVSMGWFSSFCRSGEESIGQLKTAAGILRDFGASFHLAECLKTLGNVYFVSGDYDNSLKAYEETLEIMREIDDLSGISATLNNLGNLACKNGDYSQARDFYMESLEIDRNLGNQHGVSSSLSNLAIIAMTSDDLSTAEENLEEALDIESKIGDKFNTAIVKGIMTDLLLKKGDFEKLEQYCSENLKTYGEVGNVWGLANTKLTLASMYLVKGDYPSASKQLIESINSIGNLEWVPLMLDILLVSARLLESMNQIQESASIATFVEEHKSRSEEQRDKAERIIAGFSSHFSQIELKTFHKIDSALEYVVSCLLRYEQ